MDVQAYLIDRVSFYLDIPAEEVELGIPLTEFGLDSVYAIALCGDIEDELRIGMEPTLLWDIADLAALSAHLTGLLAEQPAH